MCNFFVCTAPPATSKYSLVVLAIRDEVLVRPTAKADWRDGVLAGIDLQDPARGTWFGVTESGRVAALVSITQLREEKRSDVISRGTIPHRYLRTEDTSQFWEEITSNSQHFNGFTFIGLKRNSASGHFDMKSLTNTLVDEVAVKEWAPGSYVIGNCPPHTTYAKIERGRNLFEGVLAGIDEFTKDEEIVKRLIELGNDRKVCWPDAQLSSQVNEFDARGLASIFVRYGDPAVYGTRSFSVLLVDKDGAGVMHERRLVHYEKDNEQWEEQRFSFHLK